MQATARLRQLFSIAAALALVALGFVAALSTASPARATDTTPCVPTEDSYTDWMNEGDQIRTEENSPPGADSDLVRYVFVGETAPEVITPGVTGGHYSWNGGNRGVNDPPTVVPPDPAWQKNTDTEPDGHLNGATWFGTPGVGLHVLGNSPSNASWFYTVLSVPAVTDTDFLWQKQVRTFVPGNDCPTPPEECPNGDFNGDQDGCGEPPVECPDGDFNGDQDGCGTPPEEKPAVCHPVEGNGELGNGWNLISPDQASSHIDESLFPDGHYWQHETKDGRHDIYSEDGETCPDQTPPPEECPDGDFNGDQDGCGEPPVECPDGDFNGDQEGCGTPPEKPAVCHPVEGNGELGNGWNLISPDQASSHIDESLFPDGHYWQHETSDGRHDIYSEDGETCPDKTPPPEECPDGDFNGEEPGCGEPPVECPNGDFNGEEPGCGEPDPGPNCEEDPHAEGCPPVCPEGTDNADQVIPEGETVESFCNDDEEEPNPNCEQDPTQPGCEEDNPPVPNDPGPPNGPSNHPNQPSNGPTVKGAQATSPHAVAPAAAPATQVPTAIDAGLAPSQEPAGNGGPLGLLGIATALVGAALVGLTVRPRRRIGAASHVRT